MAKRTRRDERKKVSARHRAENRKSGLDFTTLSIPEGVQLFRLDKVGIRRVDILPYRATKANPWAEVDGQLCYERTYWMHRGIGIDDNSYVCLRKTGGAACPICDYLDKLKKDPDADEELIKDLAPKERQLFNVIDLADVDKGIQVWEISFHLFGKRLDAEVRNLDDDEKDLEYFADLEDGSTLKLGVSERSFAGNTFYEVETIGFKTRRKPYDKSILDQVNDLDAMLKLEKYDKLKAIFLQTDEAESKDDDPPKGKSGGRKKTTRKKTETKSKPPSAEEAGIEVGTEVEHGEFGVCEVRRISGDGTALTLIDGEDEIYKAVGVADVRLTDGVKTKSGKEPAKEDDPPDDDEWPDDDDDDDKWGDDD